MDGSWPNTLGTLRPRGARLRRCTADQVRDDLQGYVMEHLGDPGGVLVRGFSSKAKSRWG